MTFERTFLRGLDLASEQKHIVESILERVSPSDATAWIDKLVVRDGRIAGTYFGDLAKLLCYEDFVNLYTAIGYNMTLAGFGYICGDPQNITPHCIQLDGYTCDPLSCHI